MNNLMTVILLILIAGLFSLGLKVSIDNHRAMDECVILHNGIEVRKIFDTYYCRTLDKEWIEL